MTELDKMLLESKVRGILLQFIVDADNIRKAGSKGLIMKVAEQRTDEIIELFKLQNK